MGKRLSDGELDDAMAELDTDNSGEVDFEEFKEYWEDNFASGGGLLQGIISNFGKIVQKTAQEGGSEAFHPDRYIDEDDELRARVFSLFKRIDTNGDHTLDIDEFNDYLEKRGKTVKRSVLIQRFDRIFQLSAEDETPARIEELVTRFAGRRRSLSERT